MKVHVRVREDVIKTYEYEIPDDTPVEDVQSCAETLYSGEQTVVDVEELDAAFISVKPVVVRRTDQEVRAKIAETEAELEEIGDDPAREEDVDTLDSFINGLKWALGED